MYGIKCSSDPLYELVRTSTVASIHQHFQVEALAALVAVCTLQGDRARKVKGEIKFNDLAINTVTVRLASLQEK